MNSMYGRQWRRWRRQGALQLWRAGGKIRSFRMFWRRDYKAEAQR